MKNMEMGRSATLFDLIRWRHITIDRIAAVSASG